MIGMTDLSHFLLYVAAAFVLAVVPGPGVLYVAARTLAGGRAEGAPGRGKGIYLLEMNPDTGALTERAVFPNPDNPSCLDRTITLDVCPAYPALRRHASSSSSALRAKAHMFASRSLSP